MTDNDNKKEKTARDVQCERFSDVMGFLSDIGKQPVTILKDIKNKLHKYTIGDKEVDREFEILNSISTNHFNDYKRKSEPKKELLDFLYEQYYINPDYTRGKSNWMCDIYGERLDKLKELNAITPSHILMDDNNGKGEYITLKMDSRFYDYLLTIDPKYFSETKTTLTAIEREEVDIVYSEKNEIKEYVLIPSDMFVKKTLQKAPINFEERLSSLIADYEFLEKKINNHISTYSDKELEKIIPEIYSKIDNIKNVLNEYKKANEHKFD